MQALTLLQKFFSVDMVIYAAIVLVAATALALDISGTFQIIQRSLHCSRREVQVAGYCFDARPAAPAACTVTQVHIDCPRPVW